MSHPGQARRPVARAIAAVRPSHDQLIAQAAALAALAGALDFVARLLTGA